MYYWLSIILLLVLNVAPVRAGYRQQQQRERKGSERVSAQGTRGCPFEQGELYVETASDKNLVIDPLHPQIVLYVKPPKGLQHLQQTVKVSLLDAESKETLFLKEYIVQGTTSLVIKPEMFLNRPQILSAGLICNPQRPSTTKSLRILLIPNEKN